MLRLEGRENRTIIHFVDGKQQEIDIFLAQIDAQMKDPGFLRIHDRHIVNVNHIVRIACGAKDLIELSNAEMLPIHAEQKKIITELLSDHLNNP